MAKRHLKADLILWKNIIFQSKENKMWINAYFQFKSVLMVTLEKGSLVYKNELPFRGDRFPRKNHF